MKTITQIRAMKKKGEKITMLTAYDASFTRILNEAGVDILLVGDSLGNVICGYSDTIPVTLADMIYHTKNVSRVNQTSFLISDMPFMTYATPIQALESAAALMQAGAMMVKLEGGSWLAETVQILTQRGIPVCAHLGLTPQSVHAMGGYMIQGRCEQRAKELMDEALLMEQAGAAMLVLECVTAPLATQISQALSIPVIGIGSGVDCDGQVLVLYDLLGMSFGKIPKFSKNFLAQTSSVSDAVKFYVDAVKQQMFPTQEHSFS